MLSLINLIFDDDLIMILYFNSIIGNNKLSGSMPSAFCSYYTSLENLFIGHNNLEGNLPSFSGCNELSKLYITNNSFHGLSGVTGIPKLSYLEGSYNQFDENMSILNQFVSKASLTVLSLHHNNLKGEIPNILDEFPNLYNLDLSFNKISGKLPSSFGEISLISYMYVYYIF